jgi:hypothetical protein
MRQPAFNDKPVWFDEIKRLQQEIEKDREKERRKRNRGRGWTRGGMQYIYSTP